MSSSDSLYVYNFLDSLSIKKQTSPWKKWDLLDDFQTIWNFWLRGFLQELCQDFCFRFSPKLLNDPNLIQFQVSYFKNPTDHKILEESQSSPTENVSSFSRGSPAIFPAIHHFKNVGVIQQILFYSQVDSSLFWSREMNFSPWHIFQTPPPPSLRKSDSIIQGVKTSAALKNSRSNHIRSREGNWSSKKKLKTSSSANFEAQKM